MLMNMTILFSLICLLLALAFAIARKVYAATPANELKRRAARGTEPAKQLYRAVAYGITLDFLLWGLIAIFGALGLALLAGEVSIAISVPVIIITLSLLFIWLPAGRVTNSGTKITVFLTPLIVGVLSRLHPILSRGAEQLEKHYATSHTGLFERGDVVDLITQQAEQQDSRLSIEELAIVQRALTFGDYLVRDITTSRSEVTTISSTEVLSPVVIDELHQSAAPFILVANEAEQIVGSLEVQKLGLQTSGMVADRLTPVYFLHESDTLREALHAFFVTNCPLFVVVNSFEEYVGIVTIESVLRQLLGHIPGDEFEQYTNLSAVASRHPRPAKSKSPKLIKKSGD